MGDKNPKHPLKKKKVVVKTVVSQEGEDVESAGKKAKKHNTY